MKKHGGPVRDFSKLQKAMQGEDLSSRPALDFDDTEKTFSHLSDAKLRQSHRLFTLMSKPWLTDIMSSLGMHAVKWGLPGAEWVVKSTIYPQFVGGTSLVSAKPAIAQLWERGVYSVLDYGAEAKQTEKDFNRSMKEVIRGVDFAANHTSVPVVSTKISSMARFGLLEELQSRKFDFTPELEKEYQSVIKRLDAICGKAAQKGVKIFFDAEESWIQDALDYIVTMMMDRYNRGRVIVYNTFQLYRHDRLAFLRKSHQEAQQKGYMLGAKLVRGAYMDKERDRAREMDYPSPIQPGIVATHADFNAAVRYCLENYLTIASCNASHNRESVQLQVELIESMGLPRRHEHLNFCQLYGMSDNLTFNLAQAGYNVAKYLVYGPVKEVTPYLIRRAQENTSVTGDVGRELALVKKELNRRKGG